MRPKLGSVRHLVVPLLVSGCQGANVSAPPILDTESGSGDASTGAATATSATSGSAGSSGSGSGDSGSGGSGSDPTSGTTADPPPPGDPGGSECPGLRCLPCGNGAGCADQGPYFEGTCCAAGDGLAALSIGPGSEVVDIETDGRLVWACGGFGVGINDVTDPSAPKGVAGASSRCQRIAVGPRLGDGTRRFYLAHHGDSWVPTPSLSTWEIAPDGTTTFIDEIGDPEILFEGIRWRDGDPDTLYAAVHREGVRVYTTGSDGVPSFVTAVGGFDNATKLALGPQHLYVADGEGGLKVASLANPLAPTIVASFDVPGLARDVDVDGDRLAVALGGDGVDVFDVSNPESLSLAGHIDVDGSVQGVDVGHNIIAIAAWSHVAVYDRTSLQLLATERTRSNFEQDLGVATYGNMVHVGEWEDVHTLEYRPGYIAPDIAVNSEAFSFSGNEAGSKVVVVRNRGYLDLWVSDISTAGDGVFQVDSQTLLVPPGEGRAFEVSFTPPAPVGGSGQLILQTNDPDPFHSPLRIPLVAKSTDQIDVGDQLTQDFAWLDPNGLDQLSGLEGNVVVLAYFALF